MFHSSNIPIIEEDDMKLVGLVIKNNNLKDWIVVF